MSGSKNTPEISIVFPCRNEQASLAECLEQARQAFQQQDIQPEIIVVDNASTDDSPKIAKTHGAKLISCSRVGYGAALHCGILSARGKWVAFCDADGSYPARYFPDMLKAAKEANADLLLANRLHGKILPKAMPFLNRYAGTPFLSYLIRVFFKIPVYDCNSGMRIINRARYVDLPLRTAGMEYASEMLCLAALHHWKYKEWILPAFLPDTRGGRPPHLRRWKDGYQHLKTILGIFFRKVFLKKSFLP